MRRQSLTQGIQVDADTAAPVPLTDRAPDDVLFRQAAGRQVTAAWFVAAAARLAQALPTARYVANLCEDRIAFTAAFAAILLRGGVSLLSSDRNPTRVDALALAYPDLAVIDDAFVAPILAAVVEHPDAAFPVFSPDRVAALVFTSGSTGAPQAHEKRWGALARRSASIGARFGMAGATVIGTVPPQHMYGFETTVLLPLHAPVTICCRPAFFKADVAAALTEAAAIDPAAPCILVTTPLQLRGLLDAGLAPGPRLVISATAPLASPLAARAEAAWGCTVHEIYGATEAGSVASRRTTTEESWLPLDDLRLVSALSRAGGTPQATASTDPSTAGAGIRVEADHAIPVLLADELAWDADGRFRLIGRQSDIIKLAGKRASLAGLNRILSEIDGVQDGVFVAPDDLDHRPGARLLVYAVAPDRDADAILAALRARIEPAFLPRRVVLVSSLPRNALGKLTRASLSGLSGDDRMAVIRSSAAE